MISPTFNRTPCIALRRTSTEAPSLRTFSSEESASSNVSRSDSVSSTSSIKPTGAPSFVIYEHESSSPTKVLAANPRHVRGGSISSEMGDFPGDQIIFLQQCSPEMLVPLLHRHLEMKQLMACNTTQFERLKTSIGTEKFKQIEHVWVNVTRAEMDDNEWLSITRKFLPTRPDWSLFCEMVGWDQTSQLFLTPVATPVRERRRSTTSLQESSIPEEEED